MGLTRTMSTSSPMRFARDRAAWNPANPPPTMTTFGGRPSSAPPSRRVSSVMSGTVSVPTGARNPRTLDANRSSQPLACSAVYPTGEQIDLVAGATHAVVTGVGGGLRALEVDGRARVEDFDADATPPMGAGMVLVPWPNRIAGARYSWQGREYALEVTEPARGHAIHGLPAAPSVDGRRARGGHRHPHRRRRPGVGLAGAAARRDHLRRRRRRADRHPRPDQHRGRATSPPRWAPTPTCASATPRPPTARSPWPPTGSWTSTTS